MSFTLDADTKERVRAATDIVDLVSSFVELRRQGRNFVALCPFHRDRRPSLQVNPERQTWKCWVCDVGGDVFNFVMQREGLSFPDAVRMLAERAGISIESLGGAPKSVAAGSADDKQTLFRVMAWASRLYHQYFTKAPEAAVARQYMAERGITAESIEKFEIGMAPEGWSFLLDQVQPAGYSPRHLEATGLIKRGERGHNYDFFRQRIMFPIRDSQKRVIAFGGRQLPGATEGGKYINSPESRIFTKNQHLYGLDVARDTIHERRQAIVMEGYTDVIVAHQCGLTSSVAVLGTALGSNHLKLLRHLCNQVILLLDGDEAGQRRSDEVLELFLNAQMDVRVLTLPDGLDPADYLLAHSADALLDLTQVAPDALEFKMRRVCEGFDPIEETHRANTAIEQMLTLLSSVPRSSLIADDQFLLRRNQVLARLARRFMLPEDELRNRLRHLTDRAAQNKRVDPASRLGTTGGAASLATNAPNNLGDRRPGRTDSGSARGRGLNPNLPNTTTSDPAYESTSPSISENRPARLVRPGDLSPVERELLELIISAPNLAPMVLERVLPEWLQSEAARLMLQAYHDLELEGYSLEFDSVLVAMEDPSLKSLMVTLYEQAQVKQQFVKDTPEQRLRVLTQRMGQQQEDVQRRRQLLQLEDGGLDDEAELNLLTDFIRQARQSHGLEERNMIETTKDDTQLRPGLYDDLPTGTAPEGQGSSGPAQA
ncbi:MAG: DNA primase [Pirellulaceae bacterium]|nr:DNA primase [Pirellulaceae bacterium]